MKRKDVEERAGDGRGPNERMKRSKAGLRRDEGPDRQTEWTSTRHARPSVTGPVEDMPRT